MVFHDLRARAGRSAGCVRLGAQLDALDAVRQLRLVRHLGAREMLHTAEYVKNSKYVPSILRIKSTGSARG